MNQLEKEWNEMKEETSFLYLKSASNDALHTLEGKPMLLRWKDRLLFRVLGTSLIGRTSPLKQVKSEDGDIVFQTESGSQYRFSEKQM